MKECFASEISVRQLLSLVRASLWQTPVDCRLFVDRPVDWEEIGRLSVQQTVGALALNAALTLPKEVAPPKDWILKACSFLERNRRTHQLLDKGVAEASARFAEAGIPSVLLKGQAYARAYPDPTLRQCGDIDLYIGEENYRQAYMVTKELGWESDERFASDAKHYGCINKGGVRIELHRIAGQLPSRSADRRFQEWSRKQLQPCRSGIIGGEPIDVPAPAFDVIFVFMHLYLHFINGGIGLRHLCDWVMLLHAHCKEIDVKHLEQLLEEFHLLRGWRFFTPIAVGYLGLPENECPLYSPECARAADRIMSFIIREGNFGRARQRRAVRPRGYLARKAYSFRLLTSRLYSKFWLDPNAVMKYYGSFVMAGSKKVIKDMFAAL